jgi:hypothetical protein
MVMSKFCALGATVFCMMTSVSLGYRLFQLHRTALGWRGTKREKKMGRPP